MSATSAPDQVVEKTWNACPVCTSTVHSSWVRFPELEYLRCSGCGLVFKGRELQSTRPTDLYEESYYDSSKRSRRDRRFEHRVRKAIAQISAALEYGEPERLLDVGCSVGFVMEAGQRLGIVSAGLDISRYAVERCKASGYRAKVGTLEAMPWDDGEFDLVLMKHVLEHSPAPIRVLAEVRRITTPRALVVVAVPDLRYWKGLWRRRRYRYFRPDDLGRQHYVYYTDTTLRRTLEACDFEVIATSKAIFRRRIAARSVLRHGLETIRWLFATAWARAVRLVLMRREIVFIARRK